MQQLKYGILKASVSNDMLMLLDSKCSYCLAHFLKTPCNCEPLSILANSYAPVVKKVHFRMQFETILH